MPESENRLKIDIVMVIDKLENIGKYVSLNPLFAQAVAFLQSTD